MSDSAPDPDAPQGPSRGAGLLRWVIVLASAVAASVLLALVGAPSPVLFGALLGSLLVAISPLEPPVFPMWASRLGQGLLGVSTGAAIDPQTLAGFTAHAGPVVVSVVSTIVVSIVLGQILRLRGVSPATATFSFIAGGASGVTSVAGELGADDRVVAVVQYLRVLVILVGMPVVAALVFGAEIGGATRTSLTGSLVGSADLPWPQLVFTAICLVVGLPLAHVVRIPAGSLLAPLAVAAILAVTGWATPWLGPDAVHLPGPLEAAAFAIIGLQVGLRFTRASLRQVARLLPLAIFVILLLIAVSAGIGMVLADAMGLTPLDGYLATTPGGLYAVLLTASMAGGDVTFVLAVQVVRLVLVLAAAPLLAGFYRRRPERR
ncbi:AbrB family transcriptional regulator [Mobilicoccus massiliensis]|uniref:AbrB family transcriptional regulator n=1 Tax=Mobilicoccus massiliensis TaxID=1522310 RepID=UPI00069333A2|nr:AbrB family transcriptional regulator [Mobilicoccus massiliensis]